MRVLVMNRCVRPRIPRLRSVRGVSVHMSHFHNFSLRPNYDFDTDRNLKRLICRDAIKCLRYRLLSNGFDISNFRYYISV